MVRATAAEVVKKWPKGAYPPSWDATSVGNVCTQVDSEIDGRASPAAFGTDTNHIEFANELAFRKCNYGTWAAGRMSAPAPPVWDSLMIDWYNSLLTDTEEKFSAILKRQESS